MKRSVIPIGWKLAGDDPGSPPRRPLGTVIIRIDVRWDRGRGRKESQTEAQVFGDGIIL